MSKIKIKNFGPIRDGFLGNEGWLNIDKVTVFIGNQGSGKSTVAKLISTFAWMEKVLTRKDFEVRDFTKKGHFVRQRLAYHRLENYDSQKKAELEYQGEVYHFHYSNGNLSIQEIKNGKYSLPQIMYVPSERNFISHVRTPTALKQISSSLSEFVTEVFNAGAALKHPMLLPIHEDVFVDYQRLNNIFYIKGKDYQISLTESSSGFQSLVPLYLVSWFLSSSIRSQEDGESETLSSEQRERFRQRFREINEDQILNDELRRIMISELNRVYLKSSFVNIVEEPEQNLFPSSQFGMLKALLGFNNNAANKLIMTTHSPYIINYLTVAVKAGLLQNKIEKSSAKEELEKRMERVLPKSSQIRANELAVYELNENKGSIHQLPDYEQLPSDNNYLNKSLEETNELFAQFLEIEQRI